MPLPLTVANQLTLLRMGLVPLFLILMVSGRFGWALLVFAAAGMTDALDGFIARWWKQKTTLGAYLDPVADKMLLTTATLCLAMLAAPNRIPLWTAIVFVGRDVIMLVAIVAIILTTAHREFQPALIGKATTFLQLVLIVDALYHNWRGMASPHFHALLWLTVGATAVSIVQYAARASRILSGADGRKPA